MRKKIKKEDLVEKNKKGKGNRKKNA